MSTIGFDASTVGFDALAPRFAGVLAPRFAGVFAVRGRWHGRCTGADVSRAHHSATNSTTTMKEEFPMTTHETSKQVKTWSGSFSLRAAGTAIALACLVAMSACAVDGDDEILDEQTQLAEAQCELALEQYPDDELPYLSCLMQQPVDADGNTPADIQLGKQPAGDSETMEKACNTYYGSCTGINGCSRAVGEGWEATACGSWLYVWMTVCDGQATGWGTGFCLW